MTQPNAPIAVTGASGFIGRRLCARLLASGYRVRALIRGTPLTLPGIEWVKGDLADHAALARLVAGASAVMHCAGAVRGADLAAFEQVNVAGVAHLLEAMAGTTPAPRLLHLSSLAAREPQLSSYAASKRAGEERVRAAAVASVVLRPPAVYGPGDRELMPLLEGLLAGRGVIPANAGRMSLICVDDLVGAMLAWLESPGADGDLYEVDDGHAGGYDWDAIIAAIATLRGGPVRALRVPRALLAGIAGLNEQLSRLIGRAPMLTPGKVRELFHPDWVCRAGAFGARTGFVPAFDLAAGLELTFGRHTADGR